MSHESDAGKRFADAALSPITDGRSLENARRLILSALGYTASLVPPPKGDSLEVAALRLVQTAGYGRWRRWLRNAMILLAGLLSFWPGLAQYDAVVSAGAARSSGASPVIWTSLNGRLAEEMKEIRLADKVPAEKRHILFRVSKFSTNVDRWKALWDSQPSDPVWFSRYSFAVLSSTGVLPPDYVATGERLDPGNGWYRFLNALLEWRSQRTRLPSNLSERERAYTVVLEEIRQAMEMPQFTSHRNECLSRQIATLPRAEDYPGLWLNRAIMEENSEQAYGPDGLWLSELMGLTYNTPSRARPDPELLETALKKIVREPITQKRFLLFGEGGLASVLVRHCDTLLSARTGDHELELARLRNIESLLALEPFSATGTLRFTAAKWSPANPTEGLPTALSVTDAEVAPARFASRAMVERLSLRFALLVPLFSLAVCTLGYSPWRASHGPLARRLGSLLRFSDHAWIFGVAFGLPLVAYLVVTRAPSFGSLSQAQFMNTTMESTQLAAFAMTCSMVVTSIEMVRWRLGKRGAAIGMQAIGLNPGWGFVIISFCCFAGSVVIGDSHGRFLFSRVVNSGMWMMPVLVMVWPILLYWFTRGAKPERKLHRATLARSLMAPLASICLVIVAMVLVSFARDRYWTRQDTLETLRPEFAGDLTAEQHRAAIALQRRLVEILETP
ncbi:MAG: hypothetical protein CFE26_01520 [Verrucomicrobiales bacterium VVV1]|nr:MAG: hypothetical protein CFE26_01520 [Verrucomicrobiales bacterium VVV1]